MKMLHSTHAYACKIFLLCILQTFITTNTLFSQACDVPNVGTTSLGEPLSIPMGEGKNEVFLGTSAPTFRDMLGVNIAIYQLENNKLANFKGTNIQGVQKTALDVFSSFRVFYPMHRDYWVFGDDPVVPYPNSEQVPKNNISRLRLITNTAGVPLLASGQGGKMVYARESATVKGKIELVSENLKAPGAYYNVYQNYMNNNWIKMQASYDYLQQSAQPINKKFSVTLEVIPANFVQSSQYEFPSKWFTESDWGSNDAERKLNAKAFATMFARTYSPKASDCATCPKLVDIVEVGNEPWGYINPTTYHNIMMGMIEGFDEYYGKDTLNKIRILPGSFQGHHVENSNPVSVADVHSWRDYINTRLPAASKCVLDGVNIHLYSNTLNGNNLTLNNSYPEKVNQSGAQVTASSFFYTVKNLWKWLKDNPLAKKNIFITEFGWDSEGCSADRSVGVKTQAFYTIRNLLMMGRYGVKRANLYQIEDDPNVGCGFAYFASGVFKENLAPKYIFKALENFVQKMGDTKFHYALREDPNDVFAYILEKQDKPTHMVAWLARDINYVDDTKTLSQVIALGGPDLADGIGALKTVNLSFNGKTYSADASKPWYRLDGETATALNQATYLVNGQFKLSPIPILIPIVESCNPDAKAPDFSDCPTNIALTTTGISAVATWTAPTVTDNCSTVTVTNSHSSGATFPIGTTTVTYTAKDISNNVATCTFTVTVTSPCANDAEKPVFSNCPTDIVLTTTGTTAIATWTAPIATDNCTTPSVSSTHNSGAVFPIGSTTVTYIATDAKNNNATCFFTITVSNPCLNDTIAPVFSNCPANIAETTRDTAAVVIWVAPTATDNCTPNPIITSTDTSGTKFLIGVKTVTYTAKDVANNTATCRFTITVSNPCANDTLPPVFANCPGNLTQNTFGTTATVSWDAPTASDNCTDFEELNFNTTHNSGAIFPVGTTNVTYTALDAANNTATCRFTVTVVNYCLTDTLPPVFSNCPTNISLTSATTTAVATWVAPNITDNCTATPTLSSSHNSGATFPIGTTNVIYTATDAKNNSETCRFTVTVTNPCLTDTIKPVFSNCPINIALTTTGTTAIATWTAPTATDNCTTTPTITSTHLPNAAFPIGVTTVMYTAKDAKNNTTTCTFTVSVTVLPSNYCASKASEPWQDWVNGVQLGTINNMTQTNEGKFRNANSFGYSDFTDLQTTIIRGQPYPLSIKPGFSWTGRIPDLHCRVWIDYNNNKIFEDSEKAFEGKALTLFNTTLITPATVTVGVTRMRVSVKSGGYPSPCETIIQGEVEDYSIKLETDGTDCVNDKQAPSFENCPTNIVQTTAGTSAIVMWTPPTAVDNCTAVTLTSSHLPNTAFPVGETTVTYTASDVRKNERTCVFTVTINSTNSCATDKIKPVISNCPANISLTTTGTTATATWIAPTATDNCGTPTLTSSHNSGAAFPIGTTTVNYAATDAKGNIATCSFTITVSVSDPCTTDNTKPIIICPANISLTTAGTTAIATWAAPTATDNCGTPTLTSSHNSGAAFPIGTTTVAYTATDAKGNITTCSFTITVSVSDPCTTDNTKPVISNCPANISLTTAGTTAIATWTAPTATDNCGTPTLTSSHNSGAAFPIGTTTLAYTATDAKGNIATCSFTITVSLSDPCATDNTKPIISNCPANISLTTAGTTATATWIAPTATDNCGTPTLTSSHNSGAAFPIGTTTVSYAATDANGNIATCSFTITVSVSDPCATDNTKPVISNCPANISLTTTGTTATATWIAPTATDNCGTPTLTSTHTSGAAFQVGVTIVTYTATDAKNNTSTCEFSVIVNSSNPCVNDKLAPVFSNCPTNISQTTSGTTATVTWTPPTATDNCPTAPTITSSHAPNAAFPIGVTTVTYTARDASNNSVTCSFTITITPQVANYCGSKAAEPWQDWISGVQFGTINNTPQANEGKSINFSVLGYSDFTGLQTAVNRGQSYPLSIKPTFSWSGRLPLLHCRVWIDFNGNRTFEDSEKVLEGQAQTTFTSSVLIPASAISGTTRMRVSLKSGGYPTPCESYQQGEVEDYTINIAGGADCSTDTEKPVISNCPANIALTTTGTTATGTWTPPTATDNCGTATLTSTHNAGAAFPIGVTTVTYTATDAKNNTATCSFTVTVTNPCTNDIQAPVFSNCPANITQTTSVTTAMVTWAPPTASDNCTNPAVITSTHNPNATFPIGVTTVVYTATDAKNNKETCSFTVTVTNPCATDTQAPTFANCPANITQAAIGTSATVTWILPTASDNCTASPTVTSSHNPNASFPIGTTTVTYTARDASNNAGTCTFTVTITPPNVNYCALKAVEPWQDWVEGVQFGAMNNLTQANNGKSINFSVLGYSDFTSLQATVTRGQSYPLSIKPGISWSGRLPMLYCRVWIDFNGNKTFEDNEKVFEGLAQNLFNSTVIIPATATLGNTRMRVSLKSGAYAAPCEAYQQGEVEDYTVIIK
jgi:hypothetical protein